MKIIFLLFIALSFIGISHAQLVITNEPSATALAQRLVGPGVSISNVTFTGNSLMAGHFRNLGLNNINIDSGIVITTGRAKTADPFFSIGVDGDAVNEAQWTLADTDWFLGGDPTLANAIDADIFDLYDAAVLEFDFIPSGDTIRFRYVFSSEEYTEAYVCTYNDAFGFFLSGPGIAGVKNIALVPGTNIPVSILNVNNVDVFGGGCQSNIAYYSDNVLNKYFTHDGHTVPLIAESRVQPCTSYHMKLVISDFADGLLDSGVFLEAKSLTSSVPPYLQSVTAASTCGGSQLSLNFSEPILCSSVQNTDFTVTGPGGPYTVTSWSSTACSGGAISATDITLTVSPAITTNGAFQVCLTNVSGSVSDLCGAIAPPACLNFNIATTVPSFNPVAPICGGSTAPILPTISLNGVTGTWSPAVVSNTTSGIYTFTPTVGQCAVQVTLSVTVTPGILPTFSSPGAICSGAVPPVLPAVSNNGISGTWSPAVVNNTVSGTYTFTPATGQCALPAVISITVNAVLTSNTPVTVCQSQLPYIWNGNSYPTAGTYSVTLTSTGGCDSIATLILTANAVVTSSTPVAICQSQLPYSWNGNSYPAAGTYSVTLTGAGGCDSIATLILTANPVVTSLNPLTICQEWLPYSWNGNTYPAAGTYSVTLTSSSGCDSIATLVLTVSPIATSSTPVSICENLLPYTWNGNSYPTAGIYSVTFVSNASCDSIATLILTTNNTTSSSTPVTICQAQLPYSWNGNTYPAAGTYSVTLVNSDGCDSIATLVLSTNPVSTSSTPVTVCENMLPFAWNGNSYPAAGTYSVTLTGTNGCDSIATLLLNTDAVVTSSTPVTICAAQLPYSWNGNSYPVAGTYFVTLTSSGGCDSIATLVLTANPTITSSTPLAVCQEMLPFSWNGNSYPAAGTYSVTLTSSSGCDSIATLVLTVSPVATSSTPVSICENMLPYTWNGNSYPTAGIYSVTFVSNASCDSIATLILTTNNTTSSSTPVTICQNQLPYTWNGNTYPAAGTYSVSLVNSDGCDSVASLILTTNPVSTSSTPVAVCENLFPFAWNGNSYPAAGTYSVTLTGSNGCDSIATLVLSSNPVVTSFTPVTICEDQLPYSWNGNSYPASGTYSVTLVNSNGCDSIATLILTANPTAESVTTVTICENQLPYSWNGSSYPVAGVYQAAFSTTNGCDSIAVLALNTNPVAASSTPVSICQNLLPYAWNGNSYAAAGTYLVTLTGSSGCDSLATLILTTNAVSTSFTPVAVCENQLPYSWNGNSYPAAGTYSVTLTNNAGCDSIATLILTTNTVSSSSTQIEVCDSQLPYTWNGNSYPAAGTYAVTLTGINGCDSVATLILTSSPVVTSITAVAICEDQFPYSWNGNNYPAAGSYTVTLTSSSGCDSLATLVLTANQIATSTTPVTICQNLLPYAWNNNSYNAAGTYTIALTTTAGCDSIATLILNVNNVGSSISSASTCDNQLPFIWNGQSYSTPGTHAVTLSTSAGCDSVATLNLTINPVKYSTTPVNICSASLPYLWNGQSYATAGTYVANLTTSAGCDSLATLNLTVSATPAAPAVTSPVVYCQHETTVRLTANITSAGSQLVWYTSATGGTGSSVAPLPSSSASGSTTHYVSQVNGECEGPRVPITVIINSKPNLGADRSLRICFGTTANLAGLYNTAGQVSTWTISQSILSNPFSVASAGVYQLIVQNLAGCADTATVNLAVQPPVIANAGNDDNAVYNAPYQLHGSGGGQYQWSPGTSLNNPFVANPVALLNEDATFILSVRDEIGCVDFDTVHLRVLRGPTFYVPTAFTPNGDGLNDIFRPTAVGIQSLDFFRIYNRFGELIFETSEILKGWDGTYKGLKQNAGNYVWSLKGTDKTDKIKVMKGNVVLIR